MTARVRGHAAAATGREERRPDLDQRDDEPELDGIDLDALDAGGGDPGLDPDADEDPDLAEPLDRPADIATDPSADVAADLSADRADPASVPRSHHASDPCRQAPYARPHAREALDDAPAPLPALDAGERAERRLRRLAALLAQAGSVCRGLADDLRDLRDLGAAGTGFSLAGVRRSRLMDGEADLHAMNAAATTQTRPTAPAPASAAGALVTADDVAALLRVTARTVRAWHRAGRLPRPITLGGVIRWRHETIAAWLRDQEEGAR